MDCLKTKRGVPDVQAKRQSDSYSGQVGVCGTAQVQGVVGEGEPLVGRDGEGTGTGQAMVGEFVWTVSVREQLCHEVANVGIAAAEQL